MLTLTVPITERHIERGCPITPTHRPLALALRSAFRASLVSVTPTEAWVSVDGSKQVATLPPEAVEWLAYHRSGRLVKPATFTLSFALLAA